MSNGAHKAFSPARIAAIASNTLTELVRLKVFYFLLLFALLIIGSSAFMVRFSFQEQFQVLKDVSLGAMSIFTWLLAVLATSMLLPKDIEDRTLYTILAKPVPRIEYLLGKLLGVLVLLLLSVVIMSIVFVIVLWSRQQVVVAETMRDFAQGPPEQLEEALKSVYANTFNANLLPGIATIYIKAALFAALTLLISTFASSWIFTIIVSVVVYFIGHLQGIARQYWMHDQPATWATKAFLLVVALLFPDLQLFNLVDDIVAGNAIDPSMFAKVAGLGGLYVAVYFLLGYFLFSNKEL
jgi:cobalamin synthase